MTIPAAVDVPPFCPPSRHRCGRCGDHLDDGALPDGAGDDDGRPCACGNRSFADGASVRDGVTRLPIRAAFREGPISRCPVCGHDREAILLDLVPGHRCRPCHRVDVDDTAWRRRHTADGPPPSTGFRPWLVRLAGRRTSAPPVTSTAPPRFVGDAVVTPREVVAGLAVIAVVLAVGWWVTGMGVDGDDDHDTSGAAAVSARPPADLSGPRRGGNARG